MGTWPPLQQRFVRANLGARFLSLLEWERAALSPLKPYSTHPRGVREHDLIVYAIWPNKPAMGHLKNGELKLLLVGEGSSSVGCPNLGFDRCLKSHLCETRGRYFWFPRRLKRRWTKGDRFSFHFLQSRRRRRPSLMQSYYIILYYVCVLHYIISYHTTLYHIILYYVILQGRSKRRLATA